MHTNKAHNYVFRIEEKESIVLLSGLNTNDVLTYSQNLLKY